MRYAVVAGYYLVMTSWVYWVDAGHGESWWAVAPVALVQVGVGFALGSWWALVLPVPLPLIAYPAGVPESDYGEPLPLWFGMIYAVPFAILTVFLGVVARKVSGYLSRANSESRSAPGSGPPAASRTGAAHP